MFAPTTSTDAVSGAVTGLTAPTLAPFAEITVRDMTAELAAVTAAKVSAENALAAAVANAATAKAAADAEIAKLKAEAVAAKVASDSATATAIAAKDAEIAKLKADNAAALAALKKAFNALATKWNKANPKAKVTLVK